MSEPSTDSTAAIPSALAVPLAYETAAATSWQDMLVPLAWAGIGVATGRMLSLAGQAILLQGSSGPGGAAMWLYVVLFLGTGVPLAIASVLILFRQPNALRLMWWTEVVHALASIAFSGISLALNWASFRRTSIPNYPLYFATQSLSGWLTSGGFSFVVIIVGLQIARRRRI